MSRRQVKFGLEPVPEEEDAQRPLESATPFTDIIYRRGRGLSTIKPRQPRPPQMDHSFSGSVLDLSAFFFRSNSNVPLPSETKKKKKRKKEKMFLQRLIERIRKRISRTYSSITSYVEALVARTLRRLLVGVLVSTTGLLTMILSFFSGVFIYIIWYHYTIPEMQMRVPVFFDFDPDHNTLCSSTTYCLDTNVSHPYAFIDINKYDQQYELIEVVDVKSKTAKTLVKLKPRIKAKPSKEHNRKPKKVLKRRRQWDTPGAQSISGSFTGLAESSVPRFLSPAEKYDIHLHLSLRPDVENYDGSNFMITMNMLNMDVKDIAKSKRPAILGSKKVIGSQYLHHNAMQSVLYYTLHESYIHMKQYLDSFMYVMSFFNPASYMYSIARALGLVHTVEEETTESIQVKLFERYQAKGKRSDSVRYMYIEITKPDLRINEAYLEFGVYLEPYGLRYFAYYHKTFTFVVYLVCATWLEVTTAFFTSVATYILMTIE